MQVKNKSTSTKIIPKNKLLKEKGIISTEELKEDLPSILESKNETVHPVNPYDQMFDDLFDENKFKMRNDFDRKHCKEFLKEKDKCLKPIKLDDEFFLDGDENDDVVNRITPKFTFGWH